MDRAYRTRGNGHCPFWPGSVIKITPKVIEIKNYNKVSDDGVPHGWVKVMIESINNNGPGLSLRRMLKQYGNRSYWVTPWT